MHFKNTLDFALELDSKDNLKTYRDLFYIPLQNNGEECIYMCGNSLGLQPKQTKDFIKQELDDWAKLGVEGHFHAKNPWMPYHEYLTESYTKIVGAKKSEVVAMSTLTANLHFMMVSFYRPTNSRFKIVIEADAFPSDIYAVESQIQSHGLSSEDSLIKLRPRKGEYHIRTEDIEEVIKRENESIALVMLGGVNYYTGQLFDMKRITEIAHRYNINVGFDLAHAAGNVSLELHNWGVDFAVWCSYKYLNSGPGSVAGIFVHEKHHRSNLVRHAGWWGHNKEDRFTMPNSFNPIQSAEGWQLSNPPILSLAAIKSSLSIFDKAGMDNLLYKAKNLTAFLAYLIDSIDTDRIEIITPKERGCQLSIRVRESNKNLFDKIINKGVVADWREPDVIRVAPVPLYNSFVDVFKFYHVLKSVI